MKNERKVHDVVCRLLAPRQPPIEMTDALRQRFAELDAQTTPTDQPCEVCSQGRGIPKWQGTIYDIEWRICLVCMALLKTLDKQTRRQALMGEIEKWPEWRIPYLRDWLMGTDLTIDSRKVA